MSQVFWWVVLKTTVKTSTVSWYSSAATFMIISNYSGKYREENDISAFEETEAD